MFKLIVLLVVLLLSVPFLSTRVALSQPSQDTSDLTVLDKSTVLILGDKGLGSGFVVQEIQSGKSCQIVVVTAKHVVSQQSQMSLKSKHEEIKRVSHPTSDIAVVWLEKEENCDTNTYLPVSIDLTIPRAGTEVKNIAYPRGLHYMGRGYMGEGHAFSPGDDNEMRVAWNGARYAFLWCMPGSSGSPIFHDGKVVAILVGGSTSMEMMAVVLPIHFLKDIY